MQIKNIVTGLCQKAQFLISATRLDQCPADEGVEIAFVGRSNSGKSSAINCLTKTGLARTSKTPGRTQLLNFFSLDEHRRLVDLPGYGYAKVPMPLKQHWQKHLNSYLSNRKSLVGVVLLMDIRHPFTPFDQMMLDWAQTNKMPVHILLTKADKLTYGAGRTVLLKTQKELNENWSDTASIQLFSATKRLGLDEAYQQLALWLEISAEVQGTEQAD